jgi:serine/threonine protein phosphatase PrpC
MAVEFVRYNVASMVDAGSCKQILCDMDNAIAEDGAAGETTCALAVVTPEKIFGASAGDSGVWMIPEITDYSDLTQSQRRKPFIGSGTASPVPFQHSRQAGRLLLATDGLLKYASAENIIGICRANPIDLAARRLIDLVRYKSGDLPDDVTLILTDLL